MAETLISPGVLSIENDQSFIRQQPVNVGASIIGPTVKGPVEIPTLVTSYSDFTSKFGSTLISASDTYTYFTSIAAYNYFNNGGQTLLVSRVVSGSFTSATSSFISNLATSASGLFAGITIDYSAYTVALTGSGAGLRLSNGTNDFWIIPSTINYDNTLLDIYYTQPNFTSSNYTSDQWAQAIVNKINSSSLDFALYFTASINTITDRIFISASFAGSSPNAVFAAYSGSQAGQAGGIIGTFSGGTDNVYSNAFTLETISQGVIMNSSSSMDTYGALTSGSSDNIRWEITTSNTSSGTFTVLVRRGDDITNNKVILESWTNLTLDPNSPNYVAKVIGDQTPSYNSTTNQITITGQYPNASRYVRVKSVAFPTINYFDNNGVAKPQYTASIPLNGSGSFGSALGSVMGGANFYENITAANSQGIPAASYNNMIALMSNKDDYKYNILLAPGLYNSGQTSQATSLITNTQNRGDAMLVLDLVPYNTSETSTIAQAASRDTSYAASYWPWVLVLDPDSGKQVWVPASTVMGGVFAYNDKVGEPWFAPAGINRGGLGQVVRAEQKLNQTSRDNLYTAKINPIATFPGTGVVVYGQKTLQTKASALDRVNVRRLLVTLKNYISQVALNLVFDQNTAATRNSFLAQVNPYLESVQQRQGLYAFKVVMDDSNNTPDVIDRNQMIGAIYIQPAKTSEFIYLNFNILPTGATFPS